MGYSTKKLFNCIFKLARPTDSLINLGIWEYWEVYFIPVDKVCKKFASEKSRISEKLRISEF